jgi:aspartate/methionine/tyrosine aminotransferase
MKFRTENITPPPIVKLAEAAKKYAGSQDFIDLGQGLPGHIPPKAILSSLGEKILHPVTHQYTPDQGHLELREELSLYLRRHSNYDVDPQAEITVTAGGNSAFSGAVLTLLEPGENILVPGPFYFNQIMAIQLAGGIAKPVEVDEHFQPRMDSIRNAIDEKTKAVLLVSPNNPTGAVYEQKLVDEIVDICLENEMFLLSDEAYARLVFEGSNHYSPRTRRDAEDHVIVLGSFSKDFGISGWRVGYIVGSQTFMKEFLKVQDTVTICAPTASQMLALEILKEGTEFVDDELNRLGKLRELVYIRAQEIDKLDLVRTKGTFYIFPRVLGCDDSRNLVIDMLHQIKVLTLPGSIFGHAGEGHVRISVGPLTPEAVDESFDRMAEYFA